MAGISSITWKCRRRDYCRAYGCLDMQVLCQYHLALARFKKPATKQEIQHWSKQKSGLLEATMTIDMGVSVMKP